MNSGDEHKAPLHAAETRDQRAGHHVRMDDVGIEAIDQPVEARDHRRHAPWLTRLLQRYVGDAVSPQQWLEAAARRCHHHILPHAHLHAGKIHHHVDGAVADRLCVVGEMNDSHEVADALATWRAMHGVRTR